MRLHLKLLATDLQHDAKVAEGHDGDGYTEDIGEPYDKVETCIPGRGAVVSERVVPEVR